MGISLYSQIPKELQKVADIFEDNGYIYKIYMDGKQFNVEDKNGIIQSFYPTTGTIVLHRSNKYTDHAVHSIKYSNLKRFLEYLNNPKEIQKFFK